MTITVKDILEKYETDIDIKQVNDKLLNTVIYDQKKKNYGALSITIDDIKKPVHETIKTVEKYTYNFKKGTLTIDYTKEDYSTMDVILVVSLDFTTPDEEPLKYKIGWDGFGELINFNQISYETFQIPKK